MKYYLAKTEPQDYSIDDLQRENDTVWDGIKNPQSLNTIKQMRAGERVFIYHSGGQSAITGLAEVSRDAEPSPKDPKAWTVRLKYLSHLDPPVTLKDIKADGSFADWALVRQPRLSTMPVPPEFIPWLKRLHPKAHL